jgi:hypothetical protein
MCHPSTRTSGEHGELANPSKSATETLQFCAVGCMAAWSERRLHHKCGAFSSRSVYAYLQRPLRPPKPRCRNLPAVVSGEGDARASLSSPLVLPQTLKKAVSPAVRRRRCFPDISHAFPVSEGAGPGPSRCARRPVRRCAFLSSPISSHRFGEGFQRSRSRH